MIEILKRLWNLIRSWRHVDFCHSCNIPLTKEEVRCWLDNEFKLYPLCCNCDGAIVGVNPYYTKKSTIVSGSFNTIMRPGIITAAMKEVYEPLKSLSLTDYDDVQTSTQETKAC